MTLSFGSHLGRQPDLDIAQTVGSNLPTLSPKRLREKRWCYIGIIHDEFILGAALVHLGYAANAFCFVFDRQQQRMVEKGYVLPPFSSALHFDRDADQGECLMQSRDDSIAMRHRISEGKRQLTINIAQGQTRQILADINIIEESHSQPLQLFTPMSENNIKGNSVFTQKIAGLRAQGSIETSDRRYQLDSSNSFAIFDWTNGFHNRITQWNWASAGGMSDCGLSIGINFSRKVYEYGYGENVIWINGEPQLLNEMTFAYQSDNPLKPWHIHSTDKSVDLVFTPEGKRQANENMGIAASHFIQAYGNFSGSIQDSQGKTIQLSQVGGVVEEHYAKW